MPSKKYTFTPSVNISIDPTDTGFACVITEDKEESVQDEQYYMCCTIARGMVRLAVDNPELVFSEGVKYMEEEAREKEHNKRNSGKVIDIQEFFKTIRKGLH
jgi:hypothetical protein